MKRTSTTHKPSYGLKHRLAGVIILVVFAVIIIPIFLSESGIDANGKINGNKENVDDEGNVFISRIVPLNIDNVGQQDKGSQSSTVSDPEITVINDTKPALLDLTNDSVKPASQPETIVMTPKASGELAIENPTEVVIETHETKTEVLTIAAKQPSKTAIPETEIVETGWVVRVGTFSKDANVKSVSKTLTQSGLAPKTTLITTSLGNSTRVWLGPYANRKTADKISKRLVDLVGEKGYVTRSAS